MSNGWEEMDARRKQFEEEKKKIAKQDAARKASRKAADEKKAKEAEVVAKRQNQANEDIQKLMEEAENPSGFKKIENSKLSMGGVFGGGSGSFNDRGSSTSRGPGLKAPPGAVIPGLEKAQQDKEANRRFSSYSGPRFSSVTYGSVGSTDTTSKSGSSGSGDGGIRRNLKF